MTTRSPMLRLACLVFLGLASPLPAQVDYQDNDSPWGQRADAGPDAEVPGWFYNLGITGLRAQLVADQPKALLIKYVFPKSPADGHIKIGDLIVGAGGQMFKEPHRNGYGEKVFGADGPIAELAHVLEGCQGAARNGKLALTLRRGKEIVDVELDVGQKYGAYASTYPGTCAKSDKILAELLKYLVEHQAKDGSFGDPVHNTFAPLALLASGDAKYLPAVKLNVQYHCRETRAKDKRIFDLINWSYMSAAIVLSEYHLATGEKWVLPELQEVHDHLAKSQYLHMSQINPKAKKSHPDDFPKGPKDSHGGWGHNPGFEGYGPIAMLTGQGALAYSLMDRCGIKVDREHHDAAYAFLRKGTGQNGYVWYGDKIGGPPNGWADMGRTGATGIANFLSPYSEPVYRERALSHAKVIGLHPQSFPDTHGSPPMGMAYTALAANVDPDSFRKLMDANRWWFTMAHCTDGSFYYQPNRDNAGYDSDARMTASSVVAFIFTIPKHSLVITGKDAKFAVKPADKPRVANKPMKVFVLAGQSNMQGHVNISTFDSLADDPKTLPILKEMRDADDRPRVCEKVWISSVGCEGDGVSDVIEQKGKLTAGFGASTEEIGPEFTFGIYMEKLLDEPILIIKASWGGKSLHTDFRPPSAGPYVWSDYELAQLKEQGDDLEQIKAEKAKDTGLFYRHMIEHVRKVLADIKQVVPEYDEEQGYELAGFVWFQGFNDLVSDWTYDKQMQPGGYDLYGELLAHFIRDVRNDLSAPKMPFVIGVMGIGGVEEGKKPPQKYFREAQVAPVSLSEFQGNVVAVQTAPFWDDQLAELQERMEQLESKFEEQAEKNPKLTPAAKERTLKKTIAKNFKPDELKRLKGASDGGYHYLGAAKIMAPIGKAFAEEMANLQATQ